ncbi:hypothetical protein ACTRXD_02010 [Nitrospira sp. T9]
MWQEAHGHDRPLDHDLMLSRVPFGIGRRQSLHAVAFGPFSKADVSPTVDIKMSPFRGEEIVG